jgi:hypothetical protein
VDLRADGLDGHIQALSSLRHAAFLGGYPKVIQMAIVVGITHIQIFTKLLSIYICFFLKTNPHKLTPSETMAFMPYT